MKDVYVNKLVQMDVDDLHKADENWMFYDWFSEREALKAKAKKLLAFLKRLVWKADSRMLRPSECTAFFQECCSGAYGNYLVVKICDYYNGRGVRYCVCPSDPTAQGLPTVAYFNPEVDRFENPLVFDSPGDVAAWFADPGRFRVYDSAPRERGGRPLAMCVLRDEFAKKKKGDRK